MGKYRRYMDEQRLVILQAVEGHGLAVSQHESHKRSAEVLGIRRLQAEVQQFKEIVAEKEMALRIKDSLLKKLHYEEGPTDGGARLHQ